MPTPQTLYGFIYTAFLAKLRGDLSDDIIERLWSDEYDFSTHTPIHQLLSIIVHMTYDQRKFLLDFARIQSPVLINKTLSSTFSTLSDENRIINVPQGKLSKLKACGLRKDARSIPMDYIISLLDTIWDNPLLCSLLSYFVRAERTEYPDSFILAGRKVIDKELAATQQPDRPQQLDYRCLYTEFPIPIHEEIGLVPTRTIQLWQAGLEHMINEYSSPHFILFPHYNRRKTVSYPTQADLSFDMFGYYPEEQPTHFFLVRRCTYYSIPVCVRCTSW
jgi:hypothetical protein